ncbi:hypothetical protein GCM10010211_19270 [Streptomyces albospinus]|uniref:Uncharacterized protein n=1 Tax=Streptomyces albospinus TaxID=285515 RepID=A0ABQ2UWH6_9ACTN|nr:hypothetical protein GCM10010211_19270 [Streptomyces albospinus]
MANRRPGATTGAREGATHGRAWHVGRGPAPVGHRARAFGRWLTRPLSAVRAVRAAEPPTL